MWLEEKQTYTGALSPWTTFKVQFTSSFKGDCFKTGENISPFGAKEHNWQPLAWPIKGQRILSFGGKQSGFAYFRRRSWKHSDWCTLPSFAHAWSHQPWKSRWRIIKMATTVELNNLSLTAIKKRLWKLICLNERLVVVIWINQSCSQPFSYSPLCKRGFSKSLPVDRGSWH